MQLCSNHWADLRKAIDTVGLSQFVSSSGKAAAEKIQLELQSEENKTFDPLLAANFAIWSNALEMGGLYLMTGDYCPICESVKHNGPPADFWINNAVNEQLEKAKRLGLVA